MEIDKNSSIGGDSCYMGGSIGFNYLRLGGGACSKGCAFVGWVGGGGVGWTEDTNYNGNTEIGDHLGRDSVCGRPVTTARSTPRKLVSSQAGNARGRWTRAVDSAATCGMRRLRYGRRFDTVPSGRILHNPRQSEVPSKLLSFQNLTTLLSLLSFPSVNSLLNTFKCSDLEDDIDEIKAFLAIEVSDFEEGYYDSEGDVIFFENLLSDATTHNLASKVISDHEPEHIEPLVTFSPKDDPFHPEFTRGIITTLPSRIVYDLIPPGFENDNSEDEDNELPNLDHQDDRRQSSTNPGNHLDD
ncbi:hypothetical protein Tco_0967241 [Tanacetum coccineum]